MSYISKMQRWISVTLLGNSDSLVRPGKWKDSLRWRHKEHGGVSNHQLHDCLLKRLFRCRSKTWKTSKLRVTGLCAGNSPVTGEFSAQRASNAENVSIWWRHHVKCWLSALKHSNRGSSKELEPPPPWLSFTAHLDSNLGCPNVSPTSVSVLSSRRCANVSPTCIVFWAKSCIAWYHQYENYAKTRHFRYLT